MAEDLAQERPLVVAPPSRAERARRGVYRYRFGIIYVLLAAVVGAAVGSFIVLFARPDAAPAAKWSSWQPDGSPLARVKQIADHVSTRYRLANGRQFDVALGGPLTVPTQQGEVPVGNILVQPDTSKGQAEDNDIARYDGDSAVSYGLCGLAENCAISGEAQTAEDFVLLRRQALELALYTFKYVKDVDSVVVLMPRDPQGTSSDGEDLRTSILFRRNDLSAELGNPLAQTLAGQTPRVGGIDAAELGTIVRLTQARIYRYTFQAGPTGAVLVLAPAAATA